MTYTALIWHCPDCGRAIEHDMDEDRPDVRFTSRTVGGEVKFVCGSVHCNRKEKTATIESIQIIED